MPAITCTGDCGISRGVLTMLGVIGFAGGAMAIIYGVYTVACAIFGENTIKVRIRRIR